MEIRMVDVKWDLRGSAMDVRTAEGAVGKVVAFYKQALAGTTCPVHSREAWLRVEGSTPQNLVVSIEACCRELLEKAETRVGGVSRRHQG
jgi:hypothetical protein